MNERQSKTKDGGGMKVNVNGAQSVLSERFEHLLNIKEPEGI